MKLDKFSIHVPNENSYTYKHDTYYVFRGNRKQYNEGRYQITDRILYLSRYSLVE